MLDESALRLLFQTAIGDYNGKQERLSGTGAIALPDNFNLHNLEPYQPGRRRFRGAFTTSSLADFISYVKAHGGEGFIDADNLKARVFFNLGDKEAAGHADWHATLTPKPTAAYTAIQKINGARLDQKALTDWLEDWSTNLVPYIEGSEYGSLGKAISAIRTITIKATSEQETTQQNFAASKSALDAVEAKSRLELPAGFGFVCTPYLGLQSRSFDLRLSVLTSSKDPVLVLRIVQMEAQQESIVQDFKRVLIDEIGDAAKLVIGNFSP